MIATGAQIRAGRALLGWTRQQLATATALHRNSVARWEAADVIPTQCCRVPDACSRIQVALEQAGVETFSRPAPGVRLCRKTKYVTPHERAHAHHGELGKEHKQSKSTSKTRQPVFAAKTTSWRCGATTRSGRPCVRKGLANGRCRNHGGLSSGPRTKAGRMRIAAAQKKRWTRWRRDKA